MDTIEKPTGPHHQATRRSRWARDQFAGALLRLAGGWSAIMCVVLVLAWLGEPGAGTHSASAGARGASTNV